VAAIPGVAVAVEMPVAAVPARMPAGVTVSSRPSMRTRATVAAGAAVPALATVVSARLMLR
jgi:hypothetical protein